MRRNAPIYLQGSRAIESARRTSTKSVLRREFRWIDQQGAQESGRKKTRE
jgi:hypothetical protein